MPVQPSTYTFQDLSGHTSSITSSNPNPYQGLIDTCEDEATLIQARYNTHRTVRTDQQRATLLAPDFPGINVDPILVGLLREEEKKNTRFQAPPGTHASECPSVEPQELEFVDPRHNFTFWARPPKKVRDLVGACQARLKQVVPDLWLMPLESLHMTTLEIFDSRDATAVATTRAALEPLTSTATDFPYLLHAPSTNHDQQDNIINAIRNLAPLSGSTKRARLVNPFLAYDASAVALTWVPAVTQEADTYTYHHLRRDMWELVSETSSTNARAQELGRTPRGPVAVKSRYVVPSAHMTVARNINRWDAIQEDGSCGQTALEDHDAGVVDHEKVEAFVKALDGINEWLKSECWETDDGADTSGGSMDWIIGAETGLECRVGACWFGGGESICVGKTF